VSQATKTNGIDKLPCYRSSHWIGKSMSGLRPCCHHQRGRLHVHAWWFASILQLFLHGEKRAKYEPKVTYSITDENFEVCNLVNFFVSGQSKQARKQTWHMHSVVLMPDGPAAPLVFNATDWTSGPVICSYMTGWESQGRDSEETIVDRSTDLASRCFSFSNTSV